MAAQSSSTFLSESDAADYLGISKKTLQRWRFEHKGPAYAKLNGKLIRYRHGDLDEWMNQQIVIHDPHGFIWKNQLILSIAYSNSAKLSFHAFLVNLENNSIIIFGL